MNEFSKVVWGKINLQNAVVFLYTSSKQTKKEIESGWGIHVKPWLILVNI